MAWGLPPNLENHGIVIDSTTLHTVAAAKNGSTVTVTVQGHSAHSYQLQRTDSLTAIARSLWRRGAAAVNFPQAFPLHRSAGLREYPPFPADRG